MTLWIRWLPAALWGALVLLMSAQPETFYFAAAQGPQYRWIHYGMEMAVHVLEFCVFFLLVVWPLRVKKRPWLSVIACAYGAVVVLSLLNESIQSFTPTRMFDVGDMSVDVLGGGLGALLALATDSR